MMYDVNEKRVGKMLKLSRQYLRWIQNSVFEGEITESKLEEFQMKALKLLDREEDSIIIFQLSTDKYLHRKILGLDKRPLTSNFI